MYFGDTREPSENVYNIEGYESNGQNQPSNPTSGKEMVIINQGKGSQESQADGSLEEETSNKLNRTQSVKILKSEGDNDLEVQLKDKLNEDSEKDLKK